LVSTNKPRRAKKSAPGMCASKKMTISSRGARRIPRPCGRCGSIGSHESSLTNGLLGHDRA